MLETICICGAGTMGRGIAQVVAQAGFTTILYDLEPTMLDHARSSIFQSWDQLSQKGKLPGIEVATLQERITFTSTAVDCKADLVIEAIVENIEAKTSLFQQLDVINGNRCIFASNTSSLSIEAIAETIPHPGRFIGMHFFNPATVMRLVEVVRGTLTNEETVSTIVNLVEKLGKVPVVCRDHPGFIVNRVARPYYIEALRLVEEGLSDFATIDSLMEALGFRMGPFKLMDLIGNDVNYAVSCSVYDQLGQPERLRPSPLQKEKVTGGELGKKTGSGYYKYPGTT